MSSYACILFVLLADTHSPVAVLAKTFFTDCMVFFILVPQVASTIVSISHSSHNIVRMYNHIKPQVNPLLAKSRKLRYFCY